MDQTMATLAARNHGDSGDEAALVRAARADPAAFAPLYAHYFERVYRYLRAHTATADDAADLTQQVFLRALEGLARYQERGLPFAAWLFRIARNAAIDAHRRRRPALSWEALPEGLQPLATDPEQVTLRDESLARLHDLLARLDPHKRELLALRFAAGLGAREIAAVLGKGEAATKKQLARTLQTLKEGYHGA